MGRTITEKNDSMPILTWPRVIPNHPYYTSGNCTRTRFNFFLLHSPPHIYSRSKQGPKLSFSLLQAHVSPNENSAKKTRTDTYTYIYIDTTERDFRLQWKINGRLIHHTFTLYVALPEFSLASTAFARSWWEIVTSSSWFFGSGRRIWDSRLDNLIFLLI